MEQFYQLAHAFMNHDLNTLSDPKMAFMICGVILTFLVLENGFIPTAFLPGDSLLILTGVLIYQDVLSLGVIPLLIMATFVGTWLGYMQGRFLIVNLISSIMWICPLVGFGYYLSHTKLAAEYQTQFFNIIIYLPVALLVGGMVALVWRWISKRRAAQPRD